MDTLLSVIIPAYNEEEVLPEFYNRLASILDKLSLKSEMVFVNDGSADGSLALLNSLRNKDPRVCIVDLSRNFGKEIAVSAGLDFAQGDAVVIIDADLQDPPELIADFVEKWREGNDVVYAKRIAREGETVLKKVTAHYFYRFMQNVSHVKIPEDTGDFRLLSRRAVDSLKELREQHRFMKGLFSWIGYPQVEVLYKRDPRFAGQTKWNYWKLWNFAIEGITSFTIAPLKIATYLGLSTALFSLSYALFVVMKTLMLGKDVPGYASLIVVMLFMGGVQLITLGIMGEYIGRIFNETKRRPLYFINKHLPSYSKKDHQKAIN